MNRAALVFWGSAMAVAAAYAILASLLLPFGRLELHTIAERQRVWLLTLWCGGAMGVLFGIAALLGRIGSIGAREVLDAGSVAGALDARHRSAGAGGSPFHRSFAWWSVCTGALLIVIYFAASRVLGSAL